MHCRQPGSPVLHAELLFHQREHVYAWRTGFLLAPVDRVREPDAPGHPVLRTGALAARIAGGVDHPGLHQGLVVYYFHKN